MAASESKRWSSVRIRTMLGGPPPGPGSLVTERTAVPASRTTAASPAAMRSRSERIARVRPGAGRVSPAELLAHPVDGAPQALVEADLGPPAERARGRGVVDEVAQG